MEKKKVNWTEIQCLYCGGMPFKVTLNSKPQSETTNPKVCLLDTDPSPKKTDRFDKVHSRYNIFAYSFPEDNLNKNSVFNLIGQMILYLTEILKVNDTDLLEASFCLLLNEKPKTLMQQLEKSDITIEKFSNGVYNAGFPFRFKIIVSDEMPESEAVQLKSLIKYLEEKHH